LPSIPNQYHLQGGGISVSYYPDGFGPPIAGRGSLYLAYQDAHRSEAFGHDQVRTVKVDDLGTIVSVTLITTTDIGSTTFSLLVPDIQLPEQQNSIFMHTDGITTVHRIFAGLIGHPQGETYTVTGLSGTAAVGPLPL
jgi:hypothetical protein